jgi:hypothetical protein
MAAIVGLVSIVAAAAAGLVVWTLERSGPLPIARFNALPAGSTLLGVNGSDPDVAVSPDGSHIAYQSGQSVDSGQLFVRALDGLEAQTLRGLNAPRAPFISPDGNWLAYFDGSTLKKVAMNGGPPLTICNIKGAPRGASWVTNDIVFATSDSTTGLLRVPPGAVTPRS